MSTRIVRSLIAAVLAGGLLPALCLAAPGESDAAGAEGRSRAWLGCWVPVPGEDEAGRKDLDRYRVCLAPGVEPGSFTRTSTLDGRVVAREVLNPDGRRRGVSANGCRGSAWARWSAGGERVYLDSELRCADERKKRISGAWLIDSERRRLEIEVIREGTRWELTTRRYRPAPDPVGRTDASPVAADSVQSEEATPLTTDHVIEALAYVDPVVVEAMLVDGRPRFPMSARLLLHLDEAGVPDEVIDLMVALSFPDRFSVDETTGEPALLPSADGPGVWASSGPYCPYAPGFGHGYGRCYGYGLGFGYGHHGFYRYHYLDHPPRVAPPSGGAVVNGRGYARVRPTNLPPQGLLGMLDSGGGGGGGGGSEASAEPGNSVTPQGHRSGGGRSKGVAKPR